MGSALFRLLTTLLVVLAAILVLSLPFVIAGRRLPISRLIVYADSGYVPADSLPLDSSRAANALSAVDDPELRIPITELGLVRSLKLTPDGDITLILALTTPHCPYAARLAQDAFLALQSLPGAGLVTVRVDPAIRWRPSDATERARQDFYRRFINDSNRSR
ncbi:MAG: iron-sulfur cluster assembly protein [candidate division WOR-3 bacterium]